MVVFIIIGFILAGIGCHFIMQKGEVNALQRSVDYILKDSWGRSFFDNFMLTERERPQCH